MPKQLHDLLCASIPHFLQVHLIPAARSFAEKVPYAVPPRLSAKQAHQDHLDVHAIRSFSSGPIHSEKESQELPSGWVDLFQGIRSACVTGADDGTEVMVAETAAPGTATIMVKMV
jgi:hypothetical protein